MNILILFLVAASALGAPRSGYNTINSFGMNKPHLLFHLG